MHRSPQKQDNRCYPQMTTLEQSDTSRGVSQDLLCQYLKPSLVKAQLQLASRKALLETFAQAIFENKQVQTNLEHERDKLDHVQIFYALHEREMLASTALGKGIALPHGRVNGICEPVIAIITLQTPIDYDAPDGEKVWLAACLLAPQNANDLHLGLLANLAEKLSNADFVHCVKNAKTDDVLYRCFFDE